MMQRRGVHAGVIILTVLVAMTATADWNPEDGHKMHFPQLPDPMGWDVRNTFNPAIDPQTPGGNIKILADDFKCAASGPITGIHLWGSWIHDIPHEPAQINAIHLEIWDDDRSGEFSQPGIVLWQTDVPGDLVVERFFGQGEQGWFDPNTGEAMPADHDGIWQYNITQFPEPFVQTEGTIYWLVVYFIVGDPANIVQYGWKTSLDHYEDASVWTDSLAEPVTWTRLYDPLGSGVPIDLAFVITGESAEMDFGDAPDQPYPTLLANDGARHSFTAGGPFLGVAIDAEPDGLPSPAGDGDDLTGIPDDEDGVSFTSPLIIGQLATVDVTVSAPCLLNAWVDFNGNGSWADAGEQIFSDIPVVPGTNSLSFGIPAGIAPVTAFARFRVDTNGGLSFTGHAADGEVEDYPVFIEDVQPTLDFGDAPDPTYPTLLVNDGARHTVAQSPVLGAVADPELDGQPHPAALGDDLGAPDDDEDGVVFTTPLVPGALAAVQVTVNAPCYLNAWIDFDADGSWAEAGDQIIVDHNLAPAPGSFAISFPVPDGASIGVTFARFRVDSAGGLGATGAADDGEVEDYSLTITEEGELVDFGDAPDAGYHTLVASNGARHMLSGAAAPLLLGSAIDAETDGVPTANADGDDALGSPDDEDGVTLPAASVVSPSMVPVAVTASGPGFLDGWVDWNQNGIFGDLPVERVFTAQALAPGVNPLSMNVPPGLPDGVTYSRFRFSSVAGLGPDGLAVDGEVEDYLVVVGEQVAEIGDLGDAPDPPYPTLLPQGPVHQVLSPMYLGRLVDLETDGQPDANAAGDDLLFIDDEEGVTFTTSIVPAGTAGVDVVASLPGVLDAWIDFDGDGSWGGTGEQIFLGEPVAAGTNSLLFSVPPDATPGTTFARFRYSSGPPVDYWGAAADGEVEDYELSVAEAYLDFGDAADPSYPTLLASDGARHVIPPPGQELVFLGSGVDSETDGQPDSTAAGDDSDGTDDEDGVSFSGLLAPGQSITVTFSASTDGYLNGWIDYNHDGDWSDVGEQVFVDESLVAGSNILALVPPAGSPIQTTMARFRFTSFPGVSVSLGVTGLALDGEVEDYQVAGSLIFMDGFEGGTLAAWSGSSP